MTDVELEKLFRSWWSESYPTPPGNHALITHLGWARFLLQQQAAETSRDAGERAG